MHIFYPNDEEWHPDTGATAHIANKLGNLLNSVPYYGSDGVMVGNDESLGNNDYSLQLHNTLVVPRIKKNLLSITQLTNDYPYYYIFTRYGFFVKDSKAHKVLISRKNDLLYTTERSMCSSFLLFEAMISR